MSRIQSYDEDVYMGFWINNAYGEWRGATLTLDRRRGAFLIAFLALFVSTTGRSFWEITRYILHTTFSAEASSDGLHHQRQAILRNSVLPLDALFNIVWAACVWRKRTTNVNRKIIPTAIVATVVAAAFAISSIFSSKVTTDNANEVLIAGHHCGNMSGEIPLVTNFSASVWTDFVFARTQRASLYLNYAYNCYQNQPSSNPKDCNTYIKTTLPYTKEFNATCPFDEEICISSKQNLWLDTGLLDSYQHLGLNEGPRFQLRLARHCAPLTTANYTEIYVDEAEPLRPWLRYNYGPVGTNENNATRLGIKLRFEAPRVPASAQELLWGDGYKITSLSGNEFIPQLNRPDSLTTLMWLESSSVKNLAKVEDPWLSATSPRVLPEWFIENSALNWPENRYYVAEEPAGVLGCTTVAEICNPNTLDEKRCMNPFFDSSNSGLKAWADRNDHAIISAYVQYLIYGVYGLSPVPDIFYDIQGLPALMTQFTLNGAAQVAEIPFNRWQEEMEYIFQSNLAAIQAQVVDLSTGAAHSNQRGFNTICMYVPCKRFCKSQKIRSTNYYSFSVLGISIILSVGSFIILLATFIEPVFRFILRLLRLSDDRRLVYARLDWQMNSSLQLQRLAHEGIGSGTWSRTSKAIPVTETGNLLATLDICDPEHPRLRMDRRTKHAGVGSSLSISENHNDGPSHTPGDQESSTPNGIALRWVNTV